MQLNQGHRSSSRNNQEETGKGRDQVVNGSKRPGFDVFLIGIVKYMYIVQSVNTTH